MNKPKQVSNVHIYLGCRFDFEQRILWYGKMTMIFHKMCSLCTGFSIKLFEIFQSVYGWLQLCERKCLGTPAITESSGCRGFRLNSEVGKPTTLPHCVRYVADFVPSNDRLVAEIKRFYRDCLFAERNN